MALKELLGEMPVARFMADHYGRLPYAHPGNSARLAALASWQTVEALLAQPKANVLFGRKGEPWAGTPPQTLVEAQQLIQQGYTLGVRQAHRHDPALASLAEDFHRDFQAPIDIHLYCTPAGQPGFGWHYDAEEVFILQTQGSKEWWLRKNTVNPWPLMETLPKNMRYEREIMPVIRCLLHAGDWLYIPNGYWHRTQAGEESISLSVGVRAPVALDVYDFLRTQLLDSMRWRQRLPIQGEASPLTRADLLSQYRELFAELAADLTRAFQNEDFAKAFLDRSMRRPE